MKTRILSYIMKIIFFDIVYIISLNANVNLSPELTGVYNFSVNCLQ